MFHQRPKKTPPPSPEKGTPPRVQTIPPVFYGGLDPVIYHAGFQSSPEDGREKEQKRDEVKTGALPRQGGSVAVPKLDSPLNAPLAKKKSKKMLVWVSLFFLVSVVLISVYYLLPRRPEATPLVRPDTPLPPVFVTSSISDATPSSTPPQISTSTPVEVTTDTRPFVDFPPLFLATASDLDQDGLTDTEEEVYRTDSGTVDTDTDGYLDGQEVVNLYNPTGTAPEKIIDSGLAREYIHPTFNYHLYYPFTWEVDAVDTASQEVLLSAITGDFISVHSFPKQGGEAFESWFARTAVGQKYSDLIPFSNRFLVSGWKRKDGLVGYFSTPDFFLVLVYHTGTNQTIVYPRVMEMILQSIRPRTSLDTLPDQPVLPSSNEGNSSSTTP